MKIQGPMGPIKPDDLKQKGPNKENPPLEFKKVMEQVSQDKSKVQAPSPGIPPEPLVEVGVLGGVETKLKVVLEELHGLMDLMDGYIQKLGDGSIRGADLGPILSHVGEKIQSLKNKSRSEALPQGLQDILMDLEITVAVEAAKLKRGDYS